MVDKDTVLVVNAGSSSLKVKLLPQGFSLLLERIGGDSVLKTNFSAIQERPLSNHDQALALCLDALGEKVHIKDIQAVGHRVVHGGEVYNQPILLDHAAIQVIEGLSRLAPLHNPANLEGIRAAQRLLPQSAQVAVFDTAFHATLPARAFLYGLPQAFYQQGIRKYGFHGNSHDFVTQRAASILGVPRDSLKLVSLHLGNGASAAAIAGGKSIDTSMGLTPLDGLLMGTRSGEIDPGVLLHLLQNGVSLSQLDRILNKESGLLGLSGLSNDMRDLRKAAAEGHKQAIQALEVFCYRITKTIGAYAAAMGGLDAVIFTGGIGENDAETRQQSLRGLEFLGIALDAEKNNRGEEQIQGTGARVKLLVIPTDEEAVIAQGVRQVLKDFWD